MPKSAPRAASQWTAGPAGARLCPWHTPPRPVLSPGGPAATCAMSGRRGSRSVLVTRRPGSRDASHCDQTVTLNFQIEIRFIRFRLKLLKGPPTMLVALRLKSGTARPHVEPGCSHHGLSRVQAVSAFDSCIPLSSVSSDSAVGLTKWNRNDNENGCSLSAAGESLIPDCRCTL